MAHERTRYYQETREGIYAGPLFLVSQLLQSIPLSLLTTLIGALIIFRGLKNELLCTEHPSRYVCFLISCQCWQFLVKSNHEFHRKFHQKFQWPSL